MNINLVGQSKNKNKMQLTSTQRGKKSEANCSCPTWHTDGSNNNCNNNRNHNNNSNQLTVKKRIFPNNEGICICKVSGYTYLCPGADGRMGKSMHEFANYRRRAYFLPFFFSLGGREAIQLRHHRNKEGKCEFHREYQQNGIENIQICITDLLESSNSFKENPSCPICDTVFLDNMICPQFQN